RERIRLHLDDSHFIRLLGVLSQETTAVDWSNTLMASSNLMVSYHVLPLQHIRSHFLFSWFTGTQQKEDMEEFHDEDADEEVFDGEEDDEEALELLIGIGTNVIGTNVI
ncbi:hypothetical protein Tco_0927644, partial [Tanacetum coccineum]